MFATLATSEKTAPLSAQAVLKLPAIFKAFATPPDAARATSVLKGVRAKPIAPVPTLNLAISKVPATTMAPVRVLRREQLGSLQEMRVNAAVTDTSVRHARRIATLCTAEPQQARFVTASLGMLARRVTQRVLLPPRPAVSVRATAGATTGAMEMELAHATTDGLRATAASLAPLSFARQEACSMPCARPLGRASASMTLRVISKEHRALSARRSIGDPSASSHATATIMVAAIVTVAPVGASTVSLKDIGGRRIAAPVPQAT